MTYILYLPLHCINFTGINVAVNNHNPSYSPIKINPPASKNTYLSNFFSILVMCFIIVILLYLWYRRSYRIVKSIAVVNVKRRKRYTFNSPTNYQLSKYHPRVIYNRLFNNTGDFHLPFHDTL